MAPQAGWLLTGKSPSIGRAEERSEAPEGRGSQLLSPGGFAARESFLATATLQTAVSWLTPACVDLRQTRSPFLAPCCGHTLG